MLATGPREGACPSLGPGGDGARRLVNAGPDSCGRMTQLRVWEVGRPLSSA